MGGALNILTSYKAPSSGVPTVSDSDAQAFLNAAVITDTTQANAVNDLVIGLKADSLWTLFSCIYPFVGGTASTHKWNLKDPRDLDAAFRLVYSGTVTHNSNGFAGNASNGYANTFKTVNEQNNASFFLDYTVAGSAGNYHGASGPYFIIRDGFAEYDRTFNDAAWVNDASGASPNWASTTLPTVAFRGISRTVSSAAEHMIDSLWESCGRTSTGVSSNTIWIGGVNSAGLYSSATIGFAAIGVGLNSTQAGNLNSRVATFQTALGR